MSKAVQLANFLFSSQSKIGSKIIQPVANESKKTKKRLLALWSAKMTRTLVAIYARIDLSNFIIRTLKNGFYGTLSE